MLIIVDTFNDTVTYTLDKLCVCVRGFVWVCVGLCVVNATLVNINVLMNMETSHAA